MRFEVLLFGPQASLVGKQSAIIDTPSESPSASEVLNQLAQTEPELADSLRTSRLAVNHEFAEKDQAIGPEDELALIGMVSGG